MDLPINHNQPTILHLDLNSCFASIEQQANPFLRGKPVAVAAYTTPNGCVIAPSVEAKSLGIKVGMTVRDARLICREIVVLPPDPPKYRDVHLKLRNLLREFSPSVVPLSIDEAVIDFTGTQALRRPLSETGQEIKKLIKKNIGGWLRVSIGISTNRFLAKLGATIHKPDGLEIITHKNLEEVYGRIKLTDFCGINTRYEARLNTCSIFTPLDFFHASLETLKHQVFHSVLGYYWYLKLRGWEIDDVEFKRKTYGQSYALPNYTNDPQTLSQLLMKLCEKMGRRLRHAGYCAYGIHVSCLYSDYTHWHQAATFPMPMYSTPELFNKAQLVLNRQPKGRKVTHLAVNCFTLSKNPLEQTELFDSPSAKQRKIADALDSINDKWGEYVITPALMMGLKDKIIDRVAFGGVKDLEDLYLKTGV